MTPETLLSSTVDTLFGDASSSEALKRRYRRLAKVAHPDANPGNETEASQAFEHLKRLFERAQTQLAHGPTVLLKTRRFAYEAKRRPTYTGHSCQYHETVDGKNWLKLARTAKANSLVTNEARRLKQVLALADKDWAYFPVFVESFRVNSGGKSRLQATVFSRAPEQLYSFVEVLKQYPGGINPKDAAWMFRRMLFALSVTHKAGVVHGAIMPEHILIQPEQHGVVLLDWKYATTPGTVIRHIPIGTRGWYPPEVLNRKQATFATDIWMAVKTIRYLLENRTPKPMRAFFNGCTQDNPRLRPQSAGELLEEFNDLIERMWGPRKFHPFSI